MAVHRTVPAGSCSPCSTISDTTLFFHASIAEPAATTFDRNLTFSGKLDLSVATGSGSITFTRGAANQIHIHGIVKVSHDGDPAQAQQIAANPPIEQQGNTIRIGGHQENLHNISISYEIEAPADTALHAATGSGNITDTGVGQDAKLSTGSGNITATGIDGGFKARDRFRQHRNRRFRPGRCESADGFRQHRFERRAWIARGANWFRHNQGFRNSFFALEALSWIWLHRAIDGKRAHGP